MRTFAMVVLAVLALNALVMGAWMITDGLIGRGAVTMASACGPALVLRMMSRSRQPARPVG